MVHRLLRHRHFWRTASFSEIAELYASRMLRVIAISMISAFISIYLYQEGLSVFFIALFWAAFYGFKVLVALPMTAVVAWFGPKHGILFSNLLFVPALVAYALLPTYGMWLLVPVIIFQGASSSLYAIAYMVDFSKVKNVDHAGKELAYMNIIEKLATGLSPLLGGLLAFAFSPELVLALSAVIFSISAIPLFRSKEPTLRKQRLSFRGFPWRFIRKTKVAQWAIGFDVFVSGTVWWLFTAVVIIGIGTNNEIYLANGILLSVILFSTLASSYAFGKLIDRKKGKELLNISVLFDSVTHFLRIFATTPISVAGLNIANETATTGYLMSFNRAVFDNADMSGKRIIYIGINDVISNFGAACAALLLAVIVSFIDDTRSMQYMFLAASAVVLLILTARFPLYRK